MLVDELFEVVGGWLAFDWLFELFDGGVPHGDPFESGPSVAELEKAIARESALRRVPDLTQLERDRATRRLSLLEFRRRYARLAGSEPGQDPVRSGGLYGPATAAVEAFLDRLQGMAAAEWDLAEEHLANLQANTVVRRAVLPRYRAALIAAIGAARLTAAASVADALRAAVPEPRRETGGSVLVWLPVMLVTDARAAADTIGAPLGE